MARFALAFLFAGGPPSSISNDALPSHVHASEITRHRFSCSDLRILKAEVIAIPSEGWAAHSTTHHAALTPPSSFPPGRSGRARVRRAGGWGVAHPESPSSSSSPRYWYSSGR